MTDRAAIIQMTIIDLLSDLPEPTPAAVSQARRAAGLTQQQIADLMGYTRLGWSRYEHVGPNGRSLSLMAWALMLLMTGQHPHASVTSRALNDRSSAGEKE